MTCQRNEYPREFVPHRGGDPGKEDNGRRYFHGVEFDPVAYFRQVWAHTVIPRQLQNTRRQG